MTKFLVRSALLAGLLAFGPALSLAQEVGAPQTVEDLFDKLAQLQDANLGIARQISDTQQRAAAGLQTVLNDGLVADEAQRKLADTFIDNALTLASIMLSPMATQNVAAGETFIRLLRSNIAMLESARPTARQNADLAGALEKYSVLQAQSEDLAVALANGWTRYGEVVRTAQLTDLIRPGSFDAVNRNWALANPNAGAATAAPVAEEDAEASAMPVPALTGNPPAAIAEAPADKAPVADIPQLEAPVATATVPTAEVTGTTGPARLDATAPLDVANLKDGVGTIGDWVIEEDLPGLLMATSKNINEATFDAITSVTIACGDNGTLIYQINAKANSTTYSVYSDDVLTRTVQAVENIISGPEAMAMSDTLRLAYEWAQKVPEEHRRLTVSAVDDNEIPAQLSPLGYLEARGKVLDACVQNLVAQAMGTTTIKPSTDAKLAEGDAAPANAAQGDAEAPLPDGAVIKPGLVAPVPHVKPKSFPKPTGPVDIMSGN
jgi:hypothetical protein